MTDSVKKKAKLNNPVNLTLFVRIFDRTMLISNHYGRLHSRPLGGLYSTSRRIALSLMDGV